MQCFLTWSWKAVPFCLHLPVCLCLCQLLRQSPVLSPSLDWHLCLPWAIPASLTRAMVFWRRMILNKCNDCRLYHFILYTKNRSVPCLCSHPGLDVTPDFVLGDRDLHTSQNELLPWRTQWLLRGEDCPCLSPPAVPALPP